MFANNKLCLKSIIFFSTFLFLHLLFIKQTAQATATNTNQTQFDEEIVFGSSELETNRSESSFLLDKLRLKTNRTNSSDDDGEKKLNKRNIFASFDSRTFKLIEKQLIYSYEKFGDELKKRNIICMPRSVPYNGTCIYISGKREKLSWKNAERFCRKLPFNTSLLKIENDHKYEFIHNQIIKLRQKENPIDQLVFLIGFNYTQNGWKWVNNRSLASMNLSLSNYWWDWRASHGHCGSLALLWNNDLVMRSAPCTTMTGRFMCEYSKSIS